MKKVLALLCALWLLMAPLCAGAQEPSAIYMLAGMDDQGTVMPLGTAALVGKNALLTSCWATQTEDTLVAIGFGGTLSIAEIIPLGMQGTLVLLVLSEPAPAQPLVLGSAEETMTFAAMTADGMTEQAAGHITFTGYEGDAALLYTGVRDMLPGALLLNSQGQLAGITAAAYGEGLNRYVAWPAEVLHKRISGQDGEGENVSWLTGFAAEADGGEMTVDWSSLEKPDMPEGSALYLIWKDSLNNYLSYAELDWEDGSVTLGYVPGHSYRMWMQLAMDGEVHLGQSLQTAQETLCETPDAEPFALYQYKDTSIYLGAAPADVTLETTEEAPRLEAFTRESLTDDGLRYYLQITSTYQVTEELKTPLTIALHAPDGSVYSSTSGFIFIPELNQGDTWNAEVTELLSSCMRFTDGMPGEYTLAYYLGGQLATAFVFCIE